MNELQIFSNPEFGDMRTLSIDGEPWMVGKDVAQALGYTNPQKALRDHVDDEDRTLNESFTVNGTMATLINESGLYSLVLSSRLPGAKKFKRWVTSEVIPSIRKTGNYTAPDKLKQQQIEAKLNNSRARVASMWLKIGTLATPEYKQVCSSYASAVLSGGNEIIPLPEGTGEKLFSATEVGAILGITANRVGTLSNQNKMKTPEFGKWFYDKSRYSNKEVQVFKYNQKAVDKLRTLLEA